MSTPTVESPAETDAAAPTTRYELTGKDLLDLWKYEEDQGNTVKGRMLSIVTWLLALAAGVLGFTLKELGIIEGKQDNALIAIGLSVLGLAICIYSAFLIDEFGNHMKRHWGSADWLRARIDGLDDIKRAGGQDFPGLAEKQLPQICQRIAVIVTVFAIAFVLVFLLSMVIYFARPA